MLGSDSGIMEMCLYDGDIMDNSDSGITIEEKIREILKEVQNERDKCILENRLRGYSYSEISKICSVPKPTVQAVLKKYGLTGVRIIKTQQSQEQGLQEPPAPRYRSSSIELDALRLVRKDIADILAPLFRNEAFFTKVVTEVGKHALFTLLRYTNIGHEELEKSLNDPDKMARIVIERINTLVDYAASGASLIVEYRNALREAYRKIREYKELSMRAYEMARKFKSVLEALIPLLDEETQVRLLQTLLVKYAVESGAEVSISPQQQQQGGKGGENVSK